MYLTNEDEDYSENSVQRRKEVRDLPKLNITRMISNPAMFQETNIKEMKATLDDDDNVFSAAS